MRALRMPDVVAKVGLKRATIYALAKQGLFPSSIKLGSRSSAWLENQVDDWLRERVAVAQGDPWLLQSSGLRRLRGTRRSTPEDDPLRRASE
jgi:prophage regulatory protein